MSRMQAFVLIVGRFLLSFIFILAAANKVIDWSGSEDALITQLNLALDYYKDVEWLSNLIEYCIEYASVMLLLALVFEIIGGLLVFFGVKVRLGAVLLLLFLIPTTFFFHDFWTLEGVERKLQTSMFLKNLSIFGGLLILLVFGSGRKAQSVGFTEIHTEE